jgi:hypothetical protein
MLLTLNIPDQIAESLREAYGNDLSRTALEHFALEGYRTGKISRFQVQVLLGFESRWDTENWLGERGVNLSYSLQDLHADRGTLDRLLGQCAP